MQASPDGATKSKSARTRKVAQPTISEGESLPVFHSRLDDFIDDASEFESLNTVFPSAGNGLESTSRYFTDAPTDTAQSRKPIELKDALEGCDEFEKVTANECYEKLVRLRNDVKSR